MEPDLELFTKSLAIYQKVVTHNYMYHREVYELLHRLLISEATSPFVFLDVACGTGSGSAQALKGAPVRRYIGIDNSQPSLDVARAELAVLACPVELRCEDFVEAIDAWNDAVDVVWVGQSVHHLLTAQKRKFMARVRTLLPATGLFLIWEPARFEDEDREEWMERFRRVRPQWPAITDEEFATFDNHHRTSDYSETSATWLEMGREAGFGRAEQVFQSPNDLTRMYRFSI